MDAEFKRIKKIGKNILGAFKINTGRDKITKSGRLTNKVLLKELVEHFVVELEELSVGERMLYPMAFNVLMHPDDYGLRKESLPFVLPEVISKFYKIIDNKKDDYPNFIPTAKYWFFQFSACELKEIEGKHGDIRIIEKGKISTVASLMALDIAANTTTETNTRFSIKPQNSDPSGDNNINMAAISNLEFRGNSTFTFTFDKDLKTNAEYIIANSDIANIKGLATLTYSKGAKNIHYEMKDNLIHISESKDTRNGRFIFKLGSDQVGDSHVQVRYLPDEKRFQIAAFGETRLSGRRLELSEGGTLKWYYLPNNSQIFMNDAVAVDFKIN